MFNYIKLESFYILPNLLLNTILILVTVLIGGILPLYERKYLALSQRRAGPKFVGYKGRLQFLADALKVLWKEYITLYKLNNLVFFILPIIFLNINLVFIVNIYWLNNLSLYNIEYNFVFLIILDMLVHILIFVTGLFLQNKYTVIASNRLFNIMFSSEIFVMVMLTVFILLSKTFSFQKYMVLCGSYKLFLLGLLLVPNILIYFLLETAKTPFDIVEAETEIIMGYHVEYSGFLFGLFVLSEYFHVFINIYILVLVFF